jgi:hypothetical protein
MQFETFMQEDKDFLEFLSIQESTSVFPIDRENRI